jgi:Dolichyl-phosphate-mannose-protein mannosyltransferase
MSASTETKSSVGWEDVVLSFASPTKRTPNAKERIAAYRLPLILAIQAALTWRLNDIVNDDEALYIHGGHVVIDHLSHGGAGDAALLNLYGSYFSGAPNAYPVVAAALDSGGGLPLVRVFSLFCMLVASVCVYKFGRHLFTENVGLLASLVFALAGSVQFIGKLATYDAPCLALIALSAMVAITKKSISSAPVVGLFLALAPVTKYAGLALVPFVLLITFLVTLQADGRPWQDNLVRAVIRGTVTVLVFAGLLIIGYRLWGSGIEGGVKFTTTGRHALQPESMPYLLKSLLYDIGLTYALAVIGIFLTLRRHSWGKSALMGVMLCAGSVIQASSLRIHEFVSLDKHTAFTALFCAVPAAVLLDRLLSRRGRRILVLIPIIWLLLIGGMWRSAVQYSWPSSVMEPISEIKSLDISGTYFSFDSDAGQYYTEGNQEINWYSAAEAYSIFGQGAAKVVAMEKSHEFTGFLFQTTNLSGQNLAELHILQSLLASDHYYFETSSFRVSPYSKAVWQLWIHYPLGYNGPSLKKSNDS